MANSLSLPIWAGGFAALVPWSVLFAREVAWTYQHSHWLALFYALVVSQSVHFVEHVGQMIQIHALDLEGDAARGVIGALDVEWVHFLFNTWVILAAVMLLERFRSNRWLWVAAACAGWHEVEHAYLLAVYLATGLQSTSGLLAAGGAIGGGLPIFRADLHFLYNLAETVPLLMAFNLQLLHGARRRPRASGLP